MVLDKLIGGGRSLTLKLLMIGFLLFIFIPVTVMVYAMVDEREWRQSDARNEVAEKWGQEQQLVGPMLVVPYYGGSNANAAAYFLPEDLTVDGEFASEVRSRGIFDVPLYKSDLKLSGKFSVPNVSELALRNDQLRWDQARIFLGINDLRGISEQVVLDWQGRKLSMSSASQAYVSDSGLGTFVPYDPESSYSFSIDLKLNGSDRFTVVPVGKTTKMNLSSDWSSPSYTGDFLPDNHEETDSGFTASWTVLDLNRPFPQQWKDQQNRLGAGYNSNMGVEFFVPVDIYQKSERAVKYAMAVIFLVFLVFFLVEVMAHKRLHPVQYLMVGAGLVIFYTLLLSLGEYIRFGLAYLIAGVATVLLVGLYSMSAMKSKKLGLTTGAILTGLYVFIYVLLQIEDLTLLIGSVGLFVILAVVMYITRNVNWYKEA